MKKLTLTLMAIATTVAVFAQTTWNLDKSHSNIGFAVSHMVISETEGNFKDFDATVTTTKDDFNGAKVNFTADVNTIDTDNEKRDGHLKSDDFFSAQKYPKIVFDGKLVKKGEQYELVGDFTMKGVTKQVNFPVKYNGTIKDPYGNTRAGFKVNGMVNRTDYGLKWNSLTEAGGMVVGEEVDITCNVEIIKKG
ncbi:polyisoprenoid-binding protein [Fulvivirga sp. RKSG066]|uniref:YceI family protein n=1 Tax=Fulvivirga aurantia TaxID=2529383 RepID=UPI0012BBCBDC|nr:YceI family protein [Fulvivirga aurantia]MTI22348.1 polyisoprenoid-binding protein [Fulvivirga aurantia]